MKPNPSPHPTPLQSLYGPHSLTPSLPSSFLPSTLRSAPVIHLRGFSHENDIFDWPHQYVSLSVRVRWLDDHTPSDSLPRPHPSHPPPVSSRSLLHSCRMTEKQTNKSKASTAGRRKPATVTLESTSSGGIQIAHLRQVCQSSFPLKKKKNQKAKNNLLNGQKVAVFFWS